MSNKRGRKVGAVSFCKVSLAELNRVLQPAAQVIVSLRYAEMVGLGGQKITADSSTIKTLAKGKDVKVDIENFDDLPVTERSDEDSLRPVIQIERF